MKSMARLGKAFVLILGLFLLGGIEFHGQGPADLSGVVSSQEEGQLEGVLVSAKKEGSTITVSVVSDRQGRYSFPGDRLQPGNYRLKITATGYDLVDPAVVKLEANKTAQVDLKLEKTKDLASQMTNADWFLSNPEIHERLVVDMSSKLTPRGKDGPAGQNCTGCHSITTILKTKYPARMWPAILNRMFSYTPASIYEPGEVRVPVRASDVGRGESIRPDLEELGNFISSVNLSSSTDGTWPFELKTLPRVKGRGTRVILTEYEMPRRESQPHDVAVDANGMVWYNDHGNQYIGRLNPLTGEVKEWLVPGVAPEDAVGRSSGRPVIDANGDLWFGKVKVDVYTEEFTMGQGPVSPDGGVWNVRSSPQGDGNPRILGVNRLDPKTGETKHYDGPDRPMRFYGDEVDAQGNFYGASLQFGTVGVLNGKNGEWAFVPTPTPNSGARRATLDSQGRFWYSQYFSGHAGMFDPKTWEIKEWKLDPHAQPYAIGVDKNGEAWAAGQGAERIYRVNPETNEVTAYPKGSMGFHHSRHMFVDNSTTPVTIWIGHDHQAAIVKVEPLD